MSIITLTAQAVVHFQSILKTMPEAVGIRLGVKSSGCSGLGYTLDPVDQMQAGDQVVAIEGSALKVFIDAKSLPHVAGMELDWVANAWGGDLNFNNPNIKSQCGCGQSFNTEK